MFCACSIIKHTAVSTALPRPVSLTAGDYRSIWLYQHGGMATVAEAPASVEVNREGTLMVAAVNGTIGTQAFGLIEQHRPGRWTKRGESRFLVVSSVR